MAAMNAPIYLDYAAATPLDPSVLAAMMPYLTDRFYNPSASYMAAREVRKEVDAARAKVAFWLGARPAEIIFTAGGTESDNLAIRGIMDRFPDGNVIVSAIEHDAVLKPAMEYDCRIAPVKPDGVADIDALRALIDDRTVLISVMYANNELGTVQPIRDLSVLIGVLRKERKRQGNERPLYLHTDACQATPYLDLHTSRLGVDLLTLNASKMYGPKQVGALYVRAGVTLLPYVRGGGQERGLRSGTENVAGIIGLAAALDMVQARRHEEGRRLAVLQKHCVELLRSTLPDVRVNGSLKHRLPNNVHITIPGADNERIMMQLDEAGIQIATGSACSASSSRPSHVLDAIGLSNDEARSSVRITMGLATDEYAIERSVGALADCVSKFA